ncbi:hypothetical protein I307_06336 [Cryptococcus deuterogattii 99/473]|uniref:Uncharacterized protein n=1 Tax=Cryptococcus deuterogattii Ram5 TaxID=1296110 RepID=A0A0D0UU40_9TREE|nr:hypothetical protein I309_06000 [Cryptococcus deuterogattii LA55]KIR31157.1 hypothetical protein I352_06436 [Cryptococcus deuterogattii MMRL2647]KIR37584.1 hypothetical protein I313_06587 [Cryptococcus deuterogattii Ram5]KIR89716.1 hypothetical protein I304_06434 [Cryptococcus deuterogattii CBS 10090]KIY54334.1 hypothetical protein I307_06336 [Cryptococcus deuterogattii 99/473]
MECTIAKLETTIIKHLLDSTKTATTAIRMIINKRATIKICMDKKVIPTNSKTTEGMSTVMEDTAAVILTLGLLLSSTSGPTPDMPLRQLLTLVSSNTTVAIGQIKTTMEGLTLNISALNSMTGKPVKLLRHTLSIRGVMAGGKLCLSV